MSQIGSRAFRGDGARLIRGLPIRVRVRFRVTVPASFTAL